MRKQDCKVCSESHSETSLPLNLGLQARKRLKSRRGNRTVRYAQNLIPSLLYHSYTEKASNYYPYETETRKFSFFLLF